MPIVFSTLTRPNEYVTYKEGTAREISQVAHRVTIKGGANNVDKRNLLTPRGVATTISDEDLEHLMQNQVFQLHMKNGFITVDAAKDPRDADEVATVMEGRDDSAPEVPQDFAEGEEPIVNKDESVEVPVITPSTPAPRRRGGN